MALIDSIQSFWNLNETTGTRTDSVGGRNLTMGGTVGYSTGKYGNGASFSNNNANYLQYTAGVTAGTVTSIACWFNGTNLTQGDNDGFLVCIGSATVNLRITFDSTNRVFSYSGFNGVSPIGIYYGASGTTYYSTYNDSSFHSVVGTRNGNNFNIYVDGALHATSSTGGTYSFGSINLTIGRNNNYLAQALNGVIDDTCYWLRELSASEAVQFHMKEYPFPQTNSGFFAYF